MPQIEFDIVGNPSGLNAAVSQATGSVQTAAERGKAALDALSSGMDRLDTTSVRAAAAQLSLQRAFDSYRATMDALDARMERYLAQQTAAVDGSKRWEAAEVQLQAIERQQDAALNQLDSAADRYVLAMQRIQNANEKTTQSTSYFQRAIENVLVYGTLYRAFSSLTNFVGSTVQGLFTQPAANQDYLALQTVQLGSVAAAQQRLADVQAQAVSTGRQTLEVWREQDARLAELGITSETAQARFGRSLAQVRQDIVTLSELPRMTSDQALELFTRASDGANRLALSLQSAGLTTHTELEAMGIQFKGTSNQIISDTQTTADAVLRLIETKWPQLADLNAQTWDGITTRTRNAWDELLGILGQDITSSSRANLNQLTTFLGSDQAHAAAARYAAGIGDIAAVLTRAATTAGQLVALGPMVLELAQQRTGVDLGQFNPANLLLAAGDVAGGTSSERFVELALNVRVLTDELTHNDTALGADLNALAQLHATQQTAAAAATAHAHALQAETSAAQDDQAALAQLNTVMQALRDRSQDLQDAEKAATQPLKDDMTAIRSVQQAADAAIGDALDTLRRKEQGVRDAAQETAQAYQDQVAALRTQETQLTRNFQTQQGADKLADLNRKILEDTALSKDVFSPEGRAAGRRLQDELAQRRDMLEQQSYDKQRNALADQVTGVERNAQTAARAAQDQEASLQRQITAAQAAQKAVDAAAKTALDADQDRLDTITKGYQTVQAAITAAEHSLDRQIHTLQTSGLDAQTVVANYSMTILNTIASAEKLLKGFWSNQTLPPPLATPPSYPISPPAPTGPPQHGPEIPTVLFPPGRPSGTGPQSSTGLHLTVAFDPSVGLWVKNAVLKTLGDSQNAALLNRTLSWAGG